MTKKTYVLDKNDPEYKDRVLSQQKMLFVDERGEVLYKYEHSEPLYSEDGQWVHVMVSVSGNKSDSLNVKSSPGWRPTESLEYKQSKKLKIEELPRNEHGHIMLTDYHYNYISSVAIEVSHTNYLTAFKVDRDFSEVGIKRGYHLLDMRRNIIAIGDTYQFIDCDHFIDYAISIMQFV